MSDLLLQELSWDTVQSRKQSAREQTWIHQQLVFKGRLFLNLFSIVSSLKKYILFISVCFSLSLLPSPHPFSLVHVRACMFVCVLAPQCISGDHLTIQSQFSPSPMRIQLRGSDLVVKRHLTSHYIFFYLFIFNKLLATQTSEPRTLCPNTIAGQNWFQTQPKVLHIRIIKTNISKNNHLYLPQGYVYLGFKIGLTLIC